MKDQHRDVMLKYYNVVDDTAAVLKKLTQKATTLEKLKAKIGESAMLYTRYKIISEASKTVGKLILSCVTKEFSLLLCDQSQLINVNF